MKTVEEYKQNIQMEEVQKLVALPQSLFFEGYFHKISNIEIDYTCWSNSLIIAEDNCCISLQKAYQQHCDIYFERVKTTHTYNRDTVRKMYFALTNLKNKIMELRAVEKICNVLSSLGAVDGARRKLSAIGKHFVNGTPLSEKALSRFQNENKTKFKLDSFVEFREAYMMSYDEAKEQFEERKEVNIRNRRYAKNAVENSYNGNIDELITWIKSNVEYVQIKVPTIEVEDYEEFIVGGKNNIQKSVAEIKERVIENTRELLSEAKEQGLASDNYTVTEGQGLYSAWSIKLHSSAKETIPDAVKDWVYLKKKASDLDSYEEGLVYREKQNMITGNPIVKDIIFGYGLELKIRKINN